MEIVQYPIAFRHEAIGFADGHNHFWYICFTAKTRYMSYSLDDTTGEIIWEGSNNDRRANEWLNTYPASLIAVDFFMENLI